jgi:phosphoribosylformylglycinamidine cyclo-ligase
MSYAESGVDLKKVRLIQRRLGEQFSSTFAFRRGKFGSPTRPIGHYGGTIDIGGGKILTLHTDGVGSKVLIAQAVGRFDTIGIDCVAMTVNDLICLGSEPIALLDYLALERENAMLVKQVAKGLKEGAALASVAIVGGETAIMGDVIKGIGGSGFDLAAMGVGVVESDAIVDGSEIVEGDAVLGIASSGLHSNGYTLARKALMRHSLSEWIDELHMTLGDALLTPTSIYVKPTLSVLRRRDIHGVGHVTGGSFAKLMRLVQGRSLGFELEVPLPLPPVFEFLKREGRISELEMFRTFNMGVGLCLCLPRAEVTAVRRTFRSSGFSAFEIGSVKKGKGVEVNGLKLA